MNLVQKDTGSLANKKRTVGSQNNSEKPQSLAEFANNVRRKRPNLIRINADNQDKTFLVVFWLLFLAFVIIIVIVAQTLPSAIVDLSNPSVLKSTYLQNCTYPNTINSSNTLTCGQFNSMTPDLGFLALNLKSANQFLVVSLHIIPKTFQSTLKINTSATFTLYDMSYEQNLFKNITTHQNKTVNFIFDSSKARSYWGNDGTTKLGYQQVLGFIGDLQAENLLLILQFEEVNNDTLDSISSIGIEGITISQGFTDFTIAIRYIFFVLAIIAAVFYIRRYRQVPQQDRSFQQKMIVALSIFLLIFNDPLYPITILEPNMFSSFLSTLFVVIFIVFILFLWTTFLDRIYYQEGQKETQGVSKIKIGYFIILLILLMVLYMEYASYHIQDNPIIPERDLETGQFLALQIITFLWFLIGGVYIFVQYIRICFKKDDLLWRNQMFMTYSILFEVLIFIFFITDNSFGSFKYDGSSVLFLYAFMNFYTWYLLYMYTASGESIEAWDMKENVQSVHSDEMKSIGTIEFNDLDINLDDQRSYKPGQSIKALEKQEKENISWNKNMQMKSFEEKQNNYYKTKQKGQNSEKDSFGDSPHEFQQKQQNIDFFEDKNQNKPGMVVERRNQQKQNQKENKNKDGFGTFQLQ